MAGQKAFDSVWHAALRATTRKCNISANLIRVIEQLYDKASSAVQMNGSIGECFRTTVAVRQGCPLSPTFVNLKSRVREKNADFLDEMLPEAIEPFI